MATIQGINGQIADVNDEAQLLTSATTRDIAESANLDGRVFSLGYSVTPAVATNKIFFFLRNEDTRDLIIKVWREASTVNTIVTMLFVTGEPVLSGLPAGETGDVTKVNKNAGVSSTFAGTVQIDGNITGITGAGNLAIQAHGRVDQLDVIKFDSGVVLPQGKAIVLRRTETTGMMSGTLTVEIQE